MKSLSKTFFYFALLLAPVLLRAQSFQLKGLLLSSDSLRPIPFAAIQANKNGSSAIADERGYFTLNISKEDSLSFSAIGFFKQSYMISKSLDSTKVQLFYLKRQTYIVSGVEIRGIKNAADLKKAILQMQVTDTRLTIQGLKQYRGPMTKTKPNAIMNPISAILDSKAAKKSRAKKWNKDKAIPKMEN